MNFNGIVIWKSKFNISSFEGDSSTVLHVNGNIFIGVLSWERRKKEPPDVDGKGRVFILEFPYFLFHSESIRENIHSGYKYRQVHLLQVQMPMKEREMCDNNPRLSGDANDSFLCYHLYRMWNKKGKWILILYC